MRFEKAALITAATNIVISGANLFTGIVTARLLQPEGRGELAAIILWPSILGGLGKLGTNWALTREVAVQPKKEAELAKTAVILGVVQAILFMGIGYFILPFLLPSDKQHLINLSRIYLVFMPFNFLCLNLLAFDHGALRWKQYNLVRLSEVLFYLFCILLLCILNFKNVCYFVIALLISNLFSMLIRIYLQRSNIYRGHFRISSAIHILKRGFPFALATITIIAAMHVDKTIVVSLLPTQAVGCYVAAFTFASAHGALGGALGTTSFAAMANEKDPIKQGQFLANVFRQATLIYLGIGISVALLAPIAIVPLFGSDFVGAVAPAAILALATSLTALAQILNEGLRGRGNTSPGIISQLMGVGVVIWLGWILVPHYGLRGLSWAVVCGSVIQLLVMSVATIMLLSLAPIQLWGIRLSETKKLFFRLIYFFPNRLFYF